GLPGRHARRRRQRGYRDEPARLPGKRADVPAADAGGRPRGARAEGRGGHRTDVATAALRDPVRSDARLRGVRGARAGGAAQPPISAARAPAQRRPERDRRACRDRRGPGVCSLAAGFTPRTGARRADRAGALRDRPRPWPLALALRAAIRLRPRDRGGGAPASALPAPSGARRVAADPRPRSRIAPVTGAAVLISGTGRCYSWKGRAPAAPALPSRTVARSACGNHWAGALY